MTKGTIMKIRFIKNYRAPYSSYLRGEQIEVHNTEWTNWLIAEGYAEEIEDGRWKPTVQGEQYYYATGDSSDYISWSTFANDKHDEQLFKLGNVFKTQEQAENYANYLKARATILNDAKLAVRYFDDSWAVCDGYTGIPTIKYWTEWCRGRQPIAGFYFKTEKDAQASLNAHPDEWSTLAKYDPQPWRQQTTLAYEPETSSENGEAVTEGD